MFIDEAIRDYHAFMVRQNQRRTIIRRINTLAKQLDDEADDEYLKQVQQRHDLPHPPVAGVSNGRG